MKMDLESLAKIVEERVPTARATCVHEANQIVVTFTNRPDVEVALLTPWFQMKLKSRSLTLDEVDDVLITLKKLSNCN